MYTLMIHLHNSTSNSGVQVEYYFSDENLPNDLHLLQCCGGRENLPVSLNRICGFKKMRRFKPKSIVADALRTSTLLIVSGDGKTVQRKIPLAGKCILDPDYLADVPDHDIAYDPKVKKPAIHPVPLLPQKKREYPPGMSKNMMKPTGFEATFIEAPLKPQEAEEEVAMYDVDKPFVERIEIAIQRFKQKRRMHEMYAKVFNKWMRFGGVECSQRMFGGVTNEEKKTMAAEDLVRALATHNVPWDRQDEKQWVVDFVGVTAAFLSSFYPTHYGYDPRGVKTACQVLRSFLNYLLYHNVCPEHAPSIQESRTLCDTAESELPMVCAAGLNLPGAFNKAASTLFGGSYKDSFIGHSEWASGLGLEDPGVANEEARITFATAVCIHGSEAQFNMIRTVIGTNGKPATDLSLVRIEKDLCTSLEIIGIDMPAADTKAFYTDQNAQYKTKKLHLEPTGKLRCQNIVLESFDEYDLPASYRVQPPANDGEVVFWVEESMLEECFVGMKMDVRMLQLTGGIVVLDEVREAMCSFWRWLPNELWMERKPRDVKILDKAKPEYEEDEVVATEGAGGYAGDESDYEG